jgi:hypothetical protein
MQIHNAESVKSLEGYDVAWVEEAQTLSQRSLDLLLPTIRKPGSKLWFKDPRTPPHENNGRSFGDPVAVMFRKLGFSGTGRSAQSTFPPALDRISAQTGDFPLIPQSSFAAGYSIARFC